MVDNYTINLFNLKIMGFLTCRGDNRLKATVLYYLIWGERDAVKKRHKIKRDKKEMWTVFHKIFFYAEIYPMRFLEYFEDDLKAENVERLYNFKSYERNQVWTEPYLKKMD